MFRFAGKEDVTGSKMPGREQASAPRQKLAIRAALTRSRRPLPQLLAKVEQEQQRALRLRLRH
jgi:hypothetical protein